MEPIKLDLKDRRILNLLEMNARMPFSELAKKVELSKQVVKYRVGKLEKQNIIQQYYSIINIGHLGYTIYIIYLKLQHLTNKEENEWIKKINSHQNILATGKNATHMDLSVVIRARNNQEINQILNQIITNKKDKIQKTIITSELETTYFNLKLLHDNNTKEVHIITEIKESVIDKIDNKIMEELSLNSRITLVNLSQKTNLSANAVKFRIKRLEEKKIILAFKTKINYEKLGYLHFRVFLHLTGIDEILYNKLKVFLKSSGNVESINRYLGYCEFEFRCWTKGILELYELITELKDNFTEEIISVDSIINFDWNAINYHSN